MSAATAPPFAYFGGKTTLAERIAGLLPPHEHYVEPYAGGLSVLLAKPVSRLETVNDLDGRLMLFWRVLRERTDELIGACALTPHSRAEYHRCRDIGGDPLDGTPSGDLETARRVWVRLSQGRGGTQRLTGWRNYQAPTSTGMPGYLHAYVGRMAPAAERLAHVSLEARPALQVIATFADQLRACLYVDPPYLGSTRSARNYLVEMFTEAEHLELLTALGRCRCAVVLSGYDSPLYARHLAGWHRIQLGAVTNGSASQAIARRTEVLWFNRPLIHQPGLWAETVDGDHTAAAPSPPSPTTARGPRSWPDLDAPLTTGGAS